MGEYAAAAVALASLVAGAMASDAQGQQRGQLSAANLAQQQNNDRYSTALTAESLRRAGAGSSDSLGTETSYDPYTNTWRAMLGKPAEAAQLSKYGSDTLRGSFDAPRATYANEVASLREAQGAEGLSGARNAMINFKPMSDEAGIGAMQEATTRANNETFRPMMQAALRSAARTGSGAEPMMRGISAGNADALSKQMAENVMRGQQHAASTNQSRFGQIGDVYKSLLAGAQGGPRTYAPSGGSDPIAQITASLASRPGQQSQAAGSGAYSSAVRSGVGTTATKLASDSVPNSNFGLDVFKSTLPYAEKLTKAGSNIIDGWGSPSTSNTDWGATSGYSGYGGKSAGQGLIISDDGRVIGGI